MQKLKIFSNPSYILILVGFLSAIALLSYCLYNGGIEVVVGKPVTIILSLIFYIVCIAITLGDLPKRIKAVLADKTLTKWKCFGKIIRESVSFALVFMLYTSFAISMCIPGPGANSFGGLFLIISIAGMFIMVVFEVCIGIILGFRTYLLNRKKK